MLWGRSKLFINTVSEGFTTGNVLKMETAHTAARVTTGRLRPMTWSTRERSAICVFSGRNPPRVGFCCRGWSHRRLRTPTTVFVTLFACIQKTRSYFKNVSCSWVCFYNHSSGGDAGAESVLISGGRCLKFWVTVRLRVERWRVVLFSFFGLFKTRTQTSTTHGDHVNTASMCDTCTRVRKNFPNFDAIS